MKRRVGSKVYDTDKARAIAHNEIHRAILYVRRRGDMFLYLYGRHNPHCGAIMPVCYEQAESWCRTYAPESYDEIFGETDDDNVIVNVCVTTTRGDLRRARRAAQQRGMSLSKYLFRD